MQAMDAFHNFAFVITPESVNLVTCLTHSFSPACQLTATCKGWPAPFGIAAKNLRHFTTGRFIEAFLRKGRFTDVMKSIPIDVIVNPAVGLLGAVEAARRLVSSRA